MTLSLKHSGLSAIAERCNLFIVMLSVIMLNVIMLSVSMLNVIMLSVVMLNDVAPKKATTRY